MEVLKKQLINQSCAPGLPESHEFNSEGIKVVLTPNTTSLIQPVDQGVIRTLKLVTHYTEGYCMERIVNTTEENPNKDNCCVCINYLCFAVNIGEDI